MSIVAQARGFTGTGPKKIRAPKKAKGPSFTVPSGLYDPSLDYQQQAASRGVQDLSADTTLGNARLQDNYNLGLGQNTEDSGYQRGQLDTAHNRAYVDVGTGLTRAAQDYKTATEGLTRRYGILGGQQGEAANAAGVGEGGALVQAAMKRQANQALDQAPIDTGYQRTTQDLITQGQRANEDYGTQTGRLSQLAGRSSGQLGLTYQRGVQDSGTTLARAKRENTFYGQGIRQQKIFQATQAGWPGPPAAKKKGKKK